MQGISSYCSLPRRACVTRLRSHRTARLSVTLAADASGLPASQVAARGRRSGPAAQARHLAFYLAHVACGLPQRGVAREMRCHVSSVAYGLRRIEEAREHAGYDDLVGRLEGEIRRRLHGRAA